MHRIKVTITHSEVATTFQSNLLSKILDFLSVSNEYWKLINQSHINPLDFVNQKK